MRHMIRKQILEVNLNKAQDAFQIQNGMSQFYWKQVLPALEKVFDDLSNEDETIQLDHLDLDLGKLKSEIIISGSPFHELYNLLMKQVTEAIEKQKKKHLPEKPLSIAAQWMHYMEKGWLDWNSPTINQNWDQKVLEAFATDYPSVTALRTLVQRSSRIRQRIVIRHDEVFLLRLIEVLTAEKQEELLTFIKELRQFFVFFRFPWMRENISVLDSLEKTVWSEAILLSAIHGKKMNTIELANKILDLFIKPGSEKIGLSFLETANLSDSFLKRVLEQKKDAARPDRSEVVKVKEELNKILEKEELLTKDSEKKILEEGIFVQDAGLVLLHPFIVSFLSRLGIIEENEFIDIEKHQRALFLLYYLAHGKLPDEEYELLMPKILLAYPIEEVVPMNCSLSEVEKQEAENLLQSVIEKWEILKNTSSNGLQESFLQRNGKYFIKSDNYYLQVEQGSIDMLLDYLPWNMSIIKLPWMENLLRVEWR